METTTIVGSEVITCLEILKNSPITKEEYYVANGNLAGAIMTIVSDTLEEIEYATRDVKVGNLSMFAKRIDALRERMFQITTIADILQERVTHDGFYTLDTLMDCYGEGNNQMVEKTTKTT